MNWNLVAQLSLFGLAMGIATIFVISSRVEPLVWLVVLAISAYLIATRVSGKYFLHGLAVGVANSVWVTASHILLFGSYIANHPSMPLPGSPRLMMALVGPVIGVVSGVVLGVLAVIAAKVVGGRRASMPPG
jgi:hypothetical protein